MEAQSVEQRMNTLEHRVSHVFMEDYVRLLHRVQMLEAKVESTIEALQLDVVTPDVVPEQPLSSTAGLADEEHPGEEEHEGASDAQSSASERQGESTMQPRGFLGRLVSMGQTTQAPPPSSPTRPSQTALLSPSLPNDTKNYDNDIDALQQALIAHQTKYGTDLTHAKAQMERMTSQIVALQRAGGPDLLLGQRQPVL